MTSTTSTAVSGHMGGMTYARFFPSDWRTGCMSLTLEEEGLYIRFCAYYYDTGSAPRDDDLETSRLLRVQIQQYQKVMKSLIAKGKIIRAQGVLINERVVEELDKYRREKVARAKAATEREANRRKYLQQQIAAAVKTDGTPRGTPSLTPQGTPSRTPRGTPGGGPDVPPEVPVEVTDKFFNEINGNSTTDVPEAYQSCGTNPEARIQKPESNSKQASNLSSDETPGLAGLNGSADPMISDIVGWMTGGDRQSAKNWLSTFLGQYAQDVVRESYFDLKTQIAEGKLISQPLRVWAKIAARLKADPRQRAAVDATPAESKRDRVHKYALEEAAKMQRGGRP